MVHRVEADTDEHPLYSAEATRMDWADDVACSVHDAAYFYRAELILLNALRRSEPEQERFLAGARRRLMTIGGTAFADNELVEVFTRLAELFPVVEPCTGTGRQLASLDECPRDPERAWRKTVCGAKSRVARMESLDPDQVTGR